MLNNQIAKLLQRINLEQAEMLDAMEAIMSGEVPEIQMAAFLTALKAKGETVEEITAAARIMREKADKVPLDGMEALDTCGTGGDSAGTFNVSTAAALIAASLGVKVAKHGNRSATSLCGCADVLEELGVNISQTPEKVRSCMEQANMGFMFAPLYHKSMKHVANTRRQLGFRTLFNILGPLANPAGAQYQVLGVFDGTLAETMASVLRCLGTRHALVVHGFDGLDEITLTGPTKVVELKDQDIIRYQIAPEQFGFTSCSLKELQGGDRQTNARILRALVAGEKSPMRDMALLNAGAALYVANRSRSIGEGVEMAREAIDSGMAINTLKRLCEVSSCQ